uniref:Uncharacterized protein n=1 Tax=Strongyloides stercoralis TaxID=6248 RepID=A0A0K0E9M3_STRER
MKHSKITIKSQKPSSGRIMKSSRNNKKNSINKRTSQNKFQKNDHSSKKKKKLNVNPLNTGGMTVRSLLDTEEITDKEVKHAQTSTIVNSSMYSVDSGNISITPAENISLTSTDENKSLLINQESTQTHSCEDEDIELRVTPDFDISNVNEEILNTIRQTRLAPKKKKADM